MFYNGMIGGTIYFFFATADDNLAVFSKV